MLIGDGVPHRTSETDDRKEMKKRRHSDGHKNEKNERDNRLL